MSKLERIVEFHAAYDKRPKYGIHGVELLMALKGDAGAVQFLLFTNWHLPHVEKDLDSRPDYKYSRLLCHPQPADLGYHSKVPRYEDQTKMEHCQFVEGGCYYDGSGLNAERIYQVLLSEGSDGVWRELEAYYKETFEEVAA